MMRAEAGKPTPIMENIPQMLDHLRPVYDAFDILNNGRQVGMEPCRIQVSEIFAYLDGIGVTDDGLRELYVACIQEMDDVILAPRK